MTGSPVEIFGLADSRANQSLRRLLHRNTGLIDVGTLLRLDVHSLDVRCVNPTTTPPHIHSAGNVRCRHGIARRML